MRQPWFRQSDGWWYLTISTPAGRRHERISQDKDTAFELWHQRSARPEIDSPQVELVTICERFLEWCEQHQRPATYNWHYLYLESLCKSLGRLPVRELRNHHVGDWLDHARFGGRPRKLSAGARRAAITSLKRALNWAVQEGYINVNPVAGIRRPSAGRRDTLVDAEQLRQVMRAVDGPLRLFLLALRYTGCRPREVRVVEAQHVDLSAEVWQQVPNKTKHKTGLDRTVYLGSPCLVTVTRILMHFRPAGPLFRNSQGNAWTDNAIRCRMRRLSASYRDARKRKTTRQFPQRPRLPAKTVAYSLRHTYITDSLRAGVDAATVAALTGTSIEMIERHYGHLTQRGEHLRQAAKLASAQLAKPPSDGASEAMAAEKGTAETGDTKTGNAPGVASRRANARGGGS